MGTNLRELLPLLAELNQDRRDELALAEVADRAALSPFHAQRTFRRIVGESPKQYQLRLRLEQAAVQLVLSDDPVIDVALACGFNNHETFSRAFSRRYGRSPVAYRQLRESGRERPAGDRGDLVTSTGPCIGLYRASLTDDQQNQRQPTRRPGRPMTYEIELRTMPETPIVYIRRRVDMADLPNQLAEMLPAVFGHVMEAGLAMAGPPVVRYQEQSPAFVTIDASIPLASAPETVDHEEITAGSLQAGEAAVTVHVGPYDTLGEAHAALDRWAVENGRANGGPAWEVYLTDPGEVPDPAEWQTEVVWPLAPGS